MYYGNISGWYTILFYFFLIVVAVTVIMELIGKRDASGTGRHPIAGILVALMEALICAAFRSYGRGFDRTNLYIVCGFMLLAGICLLVMEFRSDGRWIYVEASIMCTIAALMLWNISVR